MKFDVERDRKLEKEREAEPVMVSIKYQSLDGNGHEQCTGPMPKEVFDLIREIFWEWKERMNMTHHQFKHYESLLDNDKIEEARKKL